METDFNIKWTSKITGFTWFSKPSEPFSWEEAKTILAHGQTNEITGEIIAWSEYAKETK